jgi:hypothetical protein
MVEALAVLTTRMDAVAALASLGRNLGEPVVTPLIHALETDGRAEVRAAAPGL